MSTLTRMGLIVASAAVISAAGSPSFGQKNSKQSFQDATSDLRTKRTAPRRNRVRLQAIGMLSASHVYTTYGYIGTITDGLVHKSITADKAGQLLAEVVRLVEMNTAMLKRVEEDGIPKSDVATLKKTAEIYRLLKTQAEAGIAITKSRTPENVKEFETARTLAWTQIAKLLGIGKQVGIR